MGSLVKIAVGLVVCLGFAFLAIYLLMPSYMSYAPNELSDLVSNATARDESTNTIKSDDDSTIIVSNESFALIAEPDPPLQFEAASIEAIAVAPSSSRGPASIPVPVVPPVDWSTISRTDLIKAYPGADSVDQAEILKEILSRAQRATTVTGELFPDMVYDTEHNASLTVSRATFGQATAEVSANTRTLIQDTIEPVVLEATNTQTTSRVGAELVGAGFEIDPPGITWRTIPDGMEDTFTWKVVPKREGDLQLLVVLRNEIKIGDEILNLAVNQFPKSITVSVGLWTKVGRVFTGVDTAVGTAKNIGIAVAALFGFGSLGAFYAGINAWRKRRSPGEPSG